MFYLLNLGIIIDQHNLAVQDALKSDGQEQQLTAESS